ncbi:MAG: hypothetical protein ACKVP0_16085 [Pirellulaceae bacterium]
MKNSSDWGGNLWWVLWIGLLAGKIYLANHKSHHEFKPSHFPLPQVQFNSGVKHEPLSERFKSLEDSASFKFGRQPAGLGNFGNQDAAPLPTIVPQP